MTLTAPPTSLRSPRPSIWGETRALWHLAWPILVGQMASIGMAVTDVAMAGHASAQDLAGVSLGVSIWGIVVVTLMGMVMAVNPIISHHVGAKEFDKIPHVVRQALWKALGLGVLALLLANLTSLLFDFMDLEPVVRSTAQQFVWVTSAALPAFACYRVLYGYSTSLNQTKPMMVISMLALVLNGIINWALVFGHWGFPKLGGVGCAWSTMLCVWFNTLALLWWMHRSDAYRATWPFTHWEWPHGPEVRKLLRLGLPIGVTYFAETTAFGLIALLVARFGSNPVAAHQIALNFASLVFMLPMSLGMALLTRVGQSLGAGNPQEAEFRAWVGVIVSLIASTLCAIGMAVFNVQIANAYTNDAAVAAIAAQLVFLAALFQVSDSTQVVTSCAIRGYKVTRAPMVIHLTAFWVFSLPLGCLLGWAPQGFPFVPEQPMAAQGFWIALIVGLTVAAAGLVVLLRKTARSHVYAARAAAHA